VKVGELRDRLPIKLDFPTYPLGIDGGLLQVIIHKVKFVLAWVDPQGEDPRVQGVRSTGIPCEGE